MTWIISIVILFSTCYCCSALFDRYKFRKIIIDNGGIRIIYKALLSGLLDYTSSRIVKEKKDFISIRGRYFLFPDNIVCGSWDISIQLTFKGTIIKCKTKLTLNKGVKEKRAWICPHNIDQGKILSIIKQQIDKWDVYGIIK